MSYWQLRCAEMKQRSAYLYRSGLWSDCSFKLGEEEVIVKAHKLIMAMASPVFGKLFYGREAAKSPVPIYDTRPEVFRILLEYIYSDDITLTNLRDACDLHNAAFKWELPYVKEMCIKFISSSLNAENVCCIYELACQSKEFHLQDDCIKIFKTLTKEILNAESFKEAKLSTVLKIFSMDTLNIDSELDLFKAAVNHAAAQEVEDEGLKRTHSEDCYTPSEGPSCAKRSRIDSTELDSAVEIETNNDTTADSSPAVNLNAGPSRQESHYVSEHNYAGERSTEHGMTTESYIDYEEKLLKARIKATRREKYRDLMRKIRFLTLTPQEFAECTTLSFLLPSSAILALSLNISSKDTFVPMPKHFSTSMVPRNLLNERERQAGTTRITVNNIRNLKKFESNPFYTRNLAWTLMLMHLQETVEEINRDILIIAVTCFFEKGVPEWIEKVEVRVSFVSENYSNTFQDMKLKLSEPCNDYGAWIIKKEWCDLTSAYGIIEDNTVTCKVHVSTNIQKSPTSPDSSPDSTQTDYITTPLRSSTPVSRARYLKDKTRKHSDVTASGLTETRSRTSLLPEKRSLTPLLPEKRSLTPLLPEKRSLTPLLPEKRCLTPLLPEKRSLTPLLPEKRSLTPLLPEKLSLTPLLSEKRSLTPLLPEKRSLTPLLPEKRSLTPLLPEKQSLTPPLPEKRSLTPLLPEKRSLTPLLSEKHSLTPLLPENRSITPSQVIEKRCLTQQLTEKSNQSVFPDHSLTPVLTDKRLPPVHPEKRSGSPLIEKHGVAKTPAKCNLSLLPEERNITPPPVENRILPPRPKKRYLTQSPTEKITESPEKRRLSSSALETSNLPIKNGANSSPLPPKNNATPTLPKKHVSTLTSSAINTKSPLSSQANLTKSIPAPISSPSLSEEVIIPRQTGNKVCSPQNLNSPVVGPINLNYSDPSIETLKLSVSNKDKPRALTCVQILRSLHKKGYPMNGSIAQKYLNELSAMSINGFQVLRPLLAYVNASAATNGSGHIVPAIMDKKREVLTPMNNANSASRLIDDKNTKSLTKPDQKENETLISEPIPRKDNVFSVSESMAIPDDITALSNPSAVANCTDSINEQNVKQLAIKPPALKDNKPLISEPIGTKDTVSSVSEPITLSDDVKVISNPSALMDGADAIKKKDVKQLAPKPLALKDDGTSVSEPTPIRDTVSSVSEPMEVTDDVKAMPSPSPFTDCTDSTFVSDSNLKENIPTVPQSLESSVDDESVLKLTASNNNSSSISDSISLKYDDSGTSELIDLIDSADSSLKRNSIAHPLDVKKDNACRCIISISSNSKALAENISPEPKPVDLMESVDIHSENHSIQAQLTLDDTEISKSELLVLNDTSLLDAKPVAVPLVSNPLALNNHLSSASKPMDLMEIYDTISEFHIAKAQKTRGETEHLKSIPLTLNDTIILEAQPVALPLVSEPLVLNDNLSSASKPMDLMEIYDTISELHIAEAQLTLGETEPLKSIPLTLNDAIILEAQPVALPYVSDPLVLNDNLSSASKPMDLMEIYDKISELHIAESQMTLGETERLKSEPLALNDTMLLERKPAEAPFVSNLLVLNDNLSSASKPMGLMEIYDTISELCTVKAQMTLGNTELSKSQPLTLNDTILLDAKPVSVTLVSDPLVLNDNLSPESKPMDLMEIYDTISELHTLKAQPTLGDTEPSKSQPLALNDTILLDAKPVAVPLVLDPLVLNDNLSSASKPMDLMEIYDTISELHTLKAQPTLGDTEPSKSQPLALNDTILLDAKPVAVPLVSDPLVHDNLSSASEPRQLMEIFDTISELHIAEAQMTLGETDPLKSQPLVLNDTILLEPKPAEVPSVSNPLVLNDNLSSASKPMDLMEIYDTISELHTLKARLTLGEVYSTAPNDTIPLETKPVSLKDKVTKVSISNSLTLSVSDPLALSDTIPLISNSLALNENLSSTAEPIYLNDSADANPESYSVTSRLTLGDTESSKSKPLASIRTIPSESKPVVLTKHTSSKPLVFIENVPSPLNSSTSNANSASEPMDITDSNIEPLTTEVPLTQSDTAHLIPETIELKEHSPSVSKDMAQPSKSRITCMSAFDKDRSLSSEAILKCRRNLMTLKHMKYPLSGTLAQKYLKTLKELTDKTDTDVTIHLNPKS